MKKEIKYFIPIILILSIMILPLASAKYEITEPEWFAKVASKLHWGTTWQQLIVSLAIIAIITVLIYHTFSFMNYGGKYLRILIGLIISQLLMLFDLERKLAQGYLELAGGILFLAIIYGIITAFVLFIILNISKKKILRNKIEDENERIKAMQKAGINPILR
ncbi:MAG: hypothetical protein AABX11_02025 [Nanoarchaeota archaeon]